MLRQKKTPLAIMVILLVAVLGLMVWMRHCSHSHTLSADIPDATSGDTINVAIVYAPSVYYLYGDTIGGLSYEMLLRMSAETGHPVRFYPIANLQQALAALENGNYQMIAALPATQEMKRRFLVSDDVSLDRQVLVQLKTSTGTVSVKSSLDLAGKTVHIVKDSPSLARLQNLQREIGAEIDISEHADLSEEYLVMKVASGDLQYAVVNELTALRMQKDFPDISADTPVSFTQFQSWMITPNDTALLNTVNGWLGKYKDSDDYRTLQDKYLVKPYAR